MKKTTFLSALIVLCLFANAQNLSRLAPTDLGSKFNLKNKNQTNNEKSKAKYRGTSILSEDFEGGMPSNFILYNVDNNTPYYAGTFSNLAWVVDSLDSDDENNNIAISTSYYSPIGQADDWMVIPNINIVDNCKLLWRSRSFFLDAKDGLQVYISTTGSNVADFTELLYSSTEEPYKWLEHEIDLASYSGQTVSIAFRNNTNNKRYLLVDDIEVIQSEQYDAKLISFGFDPLVYCAQIPAHMIPSISFFSNIKNNGVSDLTNVTLNVKVNNNLYNQSNSISQLGSGATDRIEISSAFDLASFAPNVFNVVYNLSSTETDGNTSNNKDSLELDLAVSDSVLSMETNVYGTNVNVVKSALLGQLFVMPLSDTISSVSVYLVAPEQTGVVSEIYHITNSDTLLVATSSTMSVSKTGWCNLDFWGQDIILNQEEKYFICVKYKTSTGWLPVAYDLNSDVASAFCFYNNSWVNYNSIGFGGILAIRANFSSRLITSGIVENNQCNFDIYPNPAKDIIHVSSSDKISKIEVLDLLGQVLSVTNPNSNKIDVNISGLSKGVYFLRVNGDAMKRVLVE